MYEFSSLDVQISRFCAKSAKFCAVARPCDRDIQKLWAQPDRFSRHKVADIWTQGATYYEHLYTCSRSKGGPLEATKVSLNLSKQGPSTIKRHHLIQNMHYPIGLGEKLLKKAYISRPHQKKFHWFVLYFLMENKCNINVFSVVYIVVQDFWPDPEPPTPELTGDSSALNCTAIIFICLHNATPQLSVQKKTALH